VQRCVLRSSIVREPANPWGLSRDETQKKPWGLDPDLLGAGKRITDEVHGTIHLTKLECLLLDSPAMQRLRRVRQLGTTHLVYPSATHSRFAHCLGALHMAQKLMTALFAQSDERDPLPDCFEEWPEEKAAEMRAEAVVLARLGGLLHDLTHLPFGHTLEDDLGLLEAHDANAARFENLWSRLDPKGLIPAPLVKELRPLILSKERDHDGKLIDPLAKAKYPFVHDVVGNTICADLLDYLWRDHRNTGLPFQLGDRFFSSLYVTPSTERLYPSRVAVKLYRNERRRPDVESELLKCLRYRYELDERALTHHTKLAADAMLGKLFFHEREALWADEYERRTGKSVRAENVSDVRRGLPKRTARAIEVRVRAQLEELLLQRGDDGVLEELARREGIVGHLAKDLLDRRLYKLLAQATGDRPRAKRLNEAYGAWDAREKVETSAATFFGLPRHHVALWIPPPKMRLKPAGVLVNYMASGRAVSTLEEADKGQGRANEIYGSHHALWRAAAYIHPDAWGDAGMRDGMKAFLSGNLADIGWDNWRWRTVEQAARDLVSAPDKKDERLDANLAAYDGPATTWVAAVERVEAALKSRRNARGPRPRARRRRAT
jgi:hypothetical protein